MKNTLKYSLKTRKNGGAAKQKQKQPQPAESRRGCSLYRRNFPAGRKNPARKARIGGLHEKPRENKSKNRQFGPAIFTPAAGGPAPGRWAAGSHHPPPVPGRGRPAMGHRQWPAPAGCAGEDGCAGSAARRSRPVPAGKDPAGTGRAGARTDPY